MVLIPIFYFNEQIDFKLSNSPEVSYWLKFVILNEKKFLKILNFIFTSDEILLKVNQQYLNHFYLTDVITFDNSGQLQIIEGDIFISIDRVKENSQLLNTSFLDELHRVMVHGVLHLIGFDDKDLVSKALIQEKENFYLNLRKI